jgi:hypothetical protein
MAAEHRSALAVLRRKASDSCVVPRFPRARIWGPTMVVITFVALVTGLVITGYSLMFSTSVQARLSSLWVIGAAALVAGGFLSAQMNGGRPYGFDVPVGLDEWKNMDADVPAAPVVPEQPKDDGTPMV